MILICGALAQPWEHPAPSSVCGDVPFRSKESPLDGPRVPRLCVLPVPRSIQRSGRSSLRCVQPAGDTLGVRGCAGQGSSGTRAGPVPGEQWQSSGPVPGELWHSSGPVPGEQWHCAQWHSSGPAPSLGALPALLPVLPSGAAPVPAANLCLLSWFT